MGAVAFFLALGGLTAMALAMDRHRRQLDLSGPTRTATRRLRAAAWLQLLLSLDLCFSIWGWGQGLLHHLGLLTAAAGLLVLVLSFAPVPCARGGLVFGPAAGAALSLLFAI